jgi:predicted O-methyltransferase YrrM
MRRLYRRLYPFLRRIFYRRFFLHLRFIYYVYFKTGSISLLLESPPGHYYSPIPDYKELLSRSRALFQQDSSECPGISQNKERQLKLLEEFSHYYNVVPFTKTPGGATRYYYDTDWFSYGDATTLYCVMRHYRPRRVVEIGSGFSSAAMLDVNELFLENAVDFTFVDPYPARLFTLFREEDKDKHTILQKPVQDVPLEVFQSLSANDILFIDSSHVVKVGSDVERILFDILPNLSKGVIIHFHDVFWPFRYPKEWILGYGRTWNEAYFLRSFLQFNNHFEIMCSTSFFGEHHTDVLREEMPLLLERSRGKGSLLGLSSLWLRKTV